MGFQQVLSNPNFGQGFQAAVQEAAASMPADQVVQAFTAPATLSRDEILASCQEGDCYGEEG